MYIDVIRRLSTAPELFRHQSFSVSLYMYPCMRIMQAAAGHTKACEDGHLSHTIVASVANDGELAQYCAF